MWQYDLRFCLKGQVEVIDQRLMIRTKTQFCKANTRSIFGANLTNNFKKNLNFVIRDCELR